MNTPHTVAVYLADGSRAADLCGSLGGEGFEPVLARSSDELYDLINRRRVDAVVVENQLRGFLRGVEIIERLSSDLVRPITVLLGGLTADEQRRAVRLKIDQLVSNREDTATVVDALRTSLLLASTSGILVPAAARSLVRQCDVIRPLPQLLVKLAGYLDHPTASIADLARDIATDPRITAELLKLTNSAALGLRGKVTRVLDAVNLLGIRHTVSLVLSSSVHRVQWQMLKPLPESFQAAFRIRSVLIGATASTFARRLKQVSAETAQILGLLQDLGMVILAQTYGERYVQLVEHARSVGTLRLEHCEEHDYGITHAQVSAALLQKWELPASMVALVLDHHDDVEQPGRADNERHFLRLMQLGEAVADLRESRSPQRHLVLSRLLQPCGGSQSELCRSALAEAVARTQESCRLFDIPAPAADDVERLRQRLFAGVAAGVGDDAVPAARGPASDYPQRAAGSSSVLVIEDEPAVVNVIRMHLHPLGVTVHGSSTAAEAQQLMPHVSAVLCDVHLNGWKSFEFIRDLKRQGLDVPVIAISGDRSRTTVTETLSAGMVDFIVKPFSRATLVDKLRKHAGLRLEAAVVTV
ncbi:MAG TPA: HDOD domain-containing protein [Planctomycetaceae bacterium]|nr:HDOD domain-containing protein [Planctomycetaceae bacterium]